MAREGALKIGKVIADNWWTNNRPISEYDDLPI